jgi:signal transduction histidine kinase
VKRRILVAIVGITIFSVVGIGFPLALAERRIERDDAVTTLEREAAAAAAEAPTPLDPVSGFDLPPPAKRDVDLSVYDLNGHRLAGKGPDRADKAVSDALDGQLNNGDSADDSLVVGWPLTANEQVYGAIRASLPNSRLQNHVHKVWGLMATLALAVIAAAVLLARVQAARLARPVAALTDAVGQIGEGDFDIQLSPSGVTEIDAAGTALTRTADRLGKLLARERTFSSDASHQLRTPLTGLRLTLETAAAGQQTYEEAVDEALAAVDRLEITIDDLLRLARDQQGPAEPIEAEAVVSEVVGQWRSRLGAEARPITFSAPACLPPVRMTKAALREIMGVLVANAAQHGGGPVTVTAGVTPGGVAVEVADEGPGVADPASAFERGAGTGNGIGLALARSLAEAEGARLTLRDSASGACFRLLVPAESVELLDS